MSTSCDSKTVTTQACGSHATERNGGRDRFCFAITGFVAPSAGSLLGAGHRQWGSVLRSANAIGTASIAIGVLVLGVKFAAAGVSHSAALYSDALETVVNVAASGLALYALIAARKPADREHNYGHTKIELLSAVAEGALILIAAMLIVQRAIATLPHPLPIQAPALGLGLNAAGGAINALWACVLRGTARRYRSPAMAADSQHLFTDALTTIGILAGLGAAVVFHAPILDPLIALAIALQIAITGGRTVLRSVSGLLDEAPPQAIVARVRDLVRTHAEGALEAHDLRMRQAGPATFLEFHLVVPGAMTVAAAHDICDRIEAALKGELDGATVTIHVEPEGKAKH
jgi:cation diffusion facilitator family transporter